MEKQKKKKITITIPAWINEEVEKKCKETFLTKSAFITKALINETLPFPEVERYKK